MESGILNHQTTIYNEGKKKIDKESWRVGFSTIKQQFLGKNMFSYANMKILVNPRQSNNDFKIGYILRKSMSHADLKILVK